MLNKSTKNKLPTIISQTMEALESSTNAPDEMTLPIALAVANYAVQGLANVNPIAWNKSPVSEFFCVLVPSGGMKSSIFSKLTDGIDMFHKAREFQYIKEMRQYNVDIKVYNNEVAKAIKDNNGDISDLEEPIKPMGNIFSITKGTVNGIIDILDNTPFLGMFNADAGSFFSSHSFQDSNRSVEMVTTLSSLWSGETVDKNTGIESKKLNLRRFNMLCLLQQELAGFLKNSQFADQGFTNRILVTQSELVMKKEIDVNEVFLKQQKEDNNTFDQFNKRVYELLQETIHRQEKKRSLGWDINMSPKQKQLQRALSYGEIQYNNAELILDAIEFESDAIPVMIAFYNKARLMSGDKNHPGYDKDYVNLWARMYEHACRLAATLALFDKQDYICKQYAECAVELCEYFVDQRMNLNVDGVIRTDPIVECGIEVVKYLTRMNKKVTKSDLVLYGPAKYRKMNTSDRTKVIEDLMSRNNIVVEQDDAIGKKTTWIYLAPHDDQNQQ